MPDFRYRLVIFGDEMRPDLILPLYEDGGDVRLWGDYAAYNLGSERPLEEITREDLPAAFDAVTAPVRITPVQIARDFQDMFVAAQAVRTAAVEEVRQAA